ncbi:MAG: hypothetical protein BWY65_02050 [Firmicutes bacterium ADurb.Bin373]|nr:MAG: hypothetical protein BWY65_02050 [Firmicutes bacterium ADurb.Bin373]
MSGLSITGYFPFTRMKIVEQHIHHEDASSAWIRLRPDWRYTHLCHTCGREVATTHSRGLVRVLCELNLVQAQVFLQVEYRKIWCPVCGGVRVDHLDFGEADQRIAGTIFM